MSEPQREQEWMERWQRRGRWWRETVIEDIVRPTLSVLATMIGLTAIVVLWILGVTAWEPYVAALGLATTPLAGVAAGVASEALRGRDSE